MDRLPLNKNTFAYYRSVGLGQREQVSTLLKAALILWTVVGCAIAFIFLAPLLVLNNDRLYLVPWCLALGVVTIAPATFLVLKGKFDPFHPIVYPVWTYFFPGFVAGGLVLAGGYSQAHYLAYVRDETSDFPLTFLYIIVGFASLASGFAISPAERIGKFVSRWLPRLELNDNDARTGATALFAVGLTCLFGAFLLGYLRYHRFEEVSVFGGLISMSTVFWYQATCILSMNFFRLPERRIRDYFLISLSVISAVATALGLGNRGGLLHFMLPILAGFLYSGRRILPKHYVGLGFIVVAVLLAGTIYGTTFRGLRGSDKPASLDDYVATVPRAIESIVEQAPADVLGFGLSAFATRIELVSSVAVVISNYEILAPYEEQYGFANNIMVEMTTFFIPRILWNDKPVPVEPAKYAELYFNYSENSFSMTPIGDLIRNFGPIGIPIGMFLLGGLLRIVHVALIADQQFSYWKISLYFLLIPAISYDGTYGGILPLLVKTAFVAAVGFLIIFSVAAWTRRRRSSI